MTSQLVAEIRVTEILANYVFDVMSIELLSRQGQHEVIKV